MQAGQKPKKPHQDSLGQGSAQSHRSARQPRNNPQNHNIHPGGSYSVHVPSQRTCGPLFTGQIAHVTYNNYYGSPERGWHSSVMMASAGPSISPWAQPPIEGIAPSTLTGMQSARPTPLAIGTPLEIDPQRGHAVAWSSESRSGIHIQPPQPQHSQQPWQRPTLEASSQPDSLFGTNSRSSPHRLIGVDIVPVDTPRFPKPTQKPSSSVGQPEIEPWTELGPPKRSGTFPSRWSPECSKSL